MDFGLKDKVAIVTGASRGIGRSIAMGFANEGCNLTICSRGEEALQEAAQAMRDKGVEVVAVAADVIRLIIRNISRTDTPLPLDHLRLFHPRPRNRIR